MRPRTPVQPSLARQPLGGRRRLQPGAHAPAGGARRLALLGGALLSGLALSACASGPPPAAPTVPVEARVTQLFSQASGLREVTVSIGLEVYNPNPTPAAMGSIQYKLDGGELLGVVEGEVPVGAELPGGDKGSLSFKAKLALPTEAEAFLAAVQKTSLPIQLSGQLKLADGAVAFSRPGEAMMPVMPKFVVNEAQAASYKGGLDLTLYLRLVNENSFTVTLDELLYTVTVAGQAQAEQTGAIGKRLPAGAAEEFEATVELKDGAFKDLGRIKKLGELKYGVKGQIKVGGVSLPFTRSATVQLRSK